MTWHAAVGSLTTDYPCDSSEQQRPCQSHARRRRNDRAAAAMHVRLSRHAASLRRSRANTGRMRRIHFCATLTAGIGRRFQGWLYTIR
eukprot:gene10755-biopygen9360